MHSPADGMLKTALAAHLNDLTAPARYLNAPLEASRKPQPLRIAARPLVCGETKGFAGVLQVPHTLPDSGSSRDTQPARMYGFKGSP